MDTIGSERFKILDYAFYPDSIAVVGASEHPLSFGYHFLRHLIEHKFKGAIYPVNPQNEIIQGLKSYPSMLEIPGNVDFVICCVATDKVLQLLDECALKQVKIVHLLTARFSETGRKEAIELERQVLAKAQEYGIRLIGPNCMGIYSPESGIAFGYNMPGIKGNIGVIFQSGGAATLLIQNGAVAGLRFSKAVSYGNALDVNECELLHYFAYDDNTSIVAAYFEGTKNGKSFFDALKTVADRKPVIVIKGGKGNAGSRAASSHTAAIAGEQDIWKIAFKQSGAIEVDDIDEMLNLLMLFYELPPVYCNRAAIMGGGGGKAVIAADLAEAAGIILPPLPFDIKNKLKAIVPGLWDWLSNPLDTSIWGDEGIKLAEVPRLFLESPDYDFLIIQSSEDNPMADDIWAYIMKMNTTMILNNFDRRGKPIIAIMPRVKSYENPMDKFRWKIIEEEKAKLINAGVPVFDSISEAVKALSRYINYWRRHQTNIHA